MAVVQDVSLDDFERESRRLQGRTAALSYEQSKGMMGEFAELLRSKPTRGEILKWWEERTECVAGATACQVTLFEDNSL